MTKKQSQAGFTLVELAIVLVIIGLLVGGVLVGQDLIKAAEVNATTTQMLKYDTAANAFRTKYNGYPGDIKNPAQFGLASTGANGTSGRADGNGIIQPGACSNANGYGGEAGMFWNHLSTVNMIPDGVTGLTDYSAVAAVTIDNTYMPAARLGLGNRFHITSITGRNYYVLSNISATTVTTCALTAAPALSAQAAFQIDTKIDDGNAATGTVASVLAAAPGTIAGGSATPDTSGNDDCYATGSGLYATTSDTLATQLACQLRLKASF